MTHEQFITRETENHECYVLPETAKLAKQAGFDWNCYKVYKTDVTENSTLFTYTKEEGYRNTSEFLCSAPTQSVLQRWLREVKGIYLHIAFYKAENGWYTYIPDTDEYSKTYSTFEAALEAGLKECLNLIIKKQ